MKKSTKITLIVIAAVVVLLAVVCISAYNGFVEDEEEVKAAQSQIDNQLQRRADLIPNFVNTVKGYSDYEKSTYTAVTEARAAVNGAKTVSEKAEASEQLDKAVSVWVNAISEAYPELKADKQYQSLLDELSGTENRIAVARKDYNEEAAEYNAELRKFPASIIAGMFGFEKFDYFEAASGSEKVPEVQF